MLNELIIFCAQYLIALPVLAAGRYFFYTSAKKEYAVLLVASVVLAYTLGKVAGLLWYDPLPFVVGGFAPLFPHAADNGFVSDHTVVSVAIALVMWFYNRRLGALLGVAAALIAVARVMAGVHHPIDVIAAAVIAIVATIILRRALSRVARRQ